MKNNQKGFSHIVIPVIIAVIAVVVFAGWYVYSKQNKDNKQPATQTQGSDTSNTEPQPTSVAQLNVFKIPELGVEFELPESLNGLYYSIGNEGRTAYFSLDSLKGTDCAADKTSQIALARYSEQDLQSEPTAAVVREKGKIIGNYYYIGIGGQAACSTDEQVQARATEMRRTIASILPQNLQPIQ